jgi:hypothetical protein
MSGPPDTRIRPRLPAPIERHYGVTNVHQESPLR